MQFFIEYILKVSIAIAIVYLLYWSLIRKLTFYNWARYFLLFFSVAVFLIPFIDISSLLSHADAQPKMILQMIPSFDQAVPTLPIEEESDSGRTTQFLVFLIFMAGTGVLATRLLIQFISFHRMRKSAKLFLSSPVKIYHVDSEIIPFSFANSIFINYGLHTESELKEIIRHEFVHVRQKHSVDILISELVCMLNWYNPFAWLMKNAIRQNLEFIADDHILRNGVDKKHYQYLLLKVTGASQFSVAANFNFSSLKKRITMMNKNKSGKAHLLKFLIALPLLAAVVVAFRKTDTPQSAREQSTRYDTLPIKESAPDATKFPEKVRSINIQNRKATVKLVDGTTEYYNLEVESERKIYKAKYGEFPKAPEPPQPPSKVQAPQPPQPPQPPLSPTPDNAFSIFMKRNPSVKGLSYTDKSQVEILLKNGEKVLINLQDKADVQNATKKFGTLPLSPPPPPPPPAAPEAPEAPSPPAVDELNAPSPVAQRNANTNSSSDPFIIPQI